jgi:ArsR family transcriptional regulator, arsenate/arsenite/antimonite-responsive transcriptional repressor
MPPPVNATLMHMNQVCQPMSDLPNRQDASERAALLKAVADPTRLQLLDMIKASPGGEACVCALTEPLGLTQPTVSHHLKILTDAGVLRREKRGTWAWYTLNRERLADIRAALID